MQNRFYRQNVALTVFFTIITLGIYLPAWFYGNVKAFNELHSQKKLGTGLIWLAVALYSGGAILLLMALIVSDPEQYQLLMSLDTLASLFGALTVLLLSFDARKIFIDHFNGHLKKEVKFSPALVLLFSVYYLQYKINAFDPEMLRDPAAPAVVE